MSPLGTAMFLLTGILGHVTGIQLLEARIPNYAASGHPAILSCPFRLSWGERVYSVNWYCSGHEFYRYYPAETPPVQTFRHPHFSVDVVSSNASTVVLNSLSRLASGIFRCEISTEAPYFNTVSYHSLMTVADIPTQGPKILELKDRYRVGELVSATCRLDKCLPAPVLTWYINGEEVSQAQVNDVTGENASEYRSRLVFRLSSRQLNSRGQLSLKCVASLDNFYWLSDQRQLVHHVDLLRSRAVRSRAPGAAYMTLGLQLSWQIPITLPLALLSVII